MSSNISRLSLDLQDEHRRMRQLRLLVDFTAQLIMQSRMSREEAERVVETMRLQVLRLFPGKETTYDIIYRPRFERIINEFAYDGETLLH
jgi:hypothetical protein